MSDGISRVSKVYIEEVVARFSPVQFKDMYLKKLRMRFQIISSFKRKIMKYSSFKILKQSIIAFSKYKDSLVIYFIKFIRNGYIICTAIKQLPAVQSENHLGNSLDRCGSTHNSLHDLFVRQLQLL